MKRKWDFNHIGLVVQDIEQVKNFVTSTGVGKFEQVFTTETGRRKQVGSAVHINHFQIDLHETIPDNLVVNDTVKTGGQGLHHICFLVHDIEREIQELCDSGSSLLWEKDIEDKDGKRIGKMAFLGMKEMGVALELKEFY